jgi:hypothetical protein
MDYIIPADFKDKKKTAGMKVRVRKARDFTGYEYKYFPLVTKLPFNAVCVKECPNKQYTAKVEKGGCVKKAGGVTKPGTDYEIVTLSKVNEETCRNACFTG